MGITLTSDLNLVWNVILALVLYKGVETILKLIVEITMWNNRESSNSQNSNKSEIPTSSTTKNDLAVDKEQLKTMIRGLTKWYVKIGNTAVGAPNTAVGLLYDDVMFGIDRLPSVTPKEPKWIPVSERLPKIADVYRVTRYYPNNVMNPNYLVDACFFDGSNTWYNDNRINHERGCANNIIAWQENPEPYKVHSEVEE